MTNIVDKNGNRLGSINQEGSRTVERDKNGNLLNYSRQEGSSTALRDKNGNLIARTR